jgi:hypothetical protein
VGGTEGVLVVVEACLSRDTRPDLIAYRARAPRFPNDPTSNQFFNDQQFEAYRTLGAGAAMRRPMRSWTIEGTTREPRHIMKSSKTGNGGRGRAASRNKGLGEGRRSVDLVGRI